MRRVPVNLTLCSVGVLAGGWSLLCCPRCWWWGRVGGETWDSGTSGTSSLQSSASCLQKLGTLPSNRLPREDRRCSHASVAQWHQYVWCEVQGRTTSKASLWDVLVSIIVFKASVHLV